MRSLRLVHRSDEHPALQPAQRTARALKLGFWGCSWGCCTVRCVNETQRGKTNQVTYVCILSIAAVTVSPGGDRLSVRKTSHARGHDKRDILYTASSWYVTTYQDRNLANSSSNLVCASLCYFIDSILMGSLDTSVGTATTLGFHFRQGQEIFLFSKTHKPPLRPIRPLVQ